MNGNSRVQARLLLELVLNFLRIDHVL